MLPRDHNIKNLAIYAPRLAYSMIVGVPRVPYVGDVHLQFTSAAVDATPIQAALEENNHLTQNTLIERVSFSLFQQNSFAGSVFQAAYFKDLKECTGVGVQLQVFGSPKYNVNDNFTPLENLADQFAMTWPNGWPLEKQSNVRVQAILLQAPNSTPYDVYMTFLGWQWLDKAMDDMSDAEARRRLRLLGFESPDLQTALSTQTTGQ